MTVLRSWLSVVGFTSDRALFMTEQLSYGDSAQNKVQQPPVNVIADFLTSFYSVNPSHWQPIITTGGNPRWQADFRSKCDRQQVPTQTKVSRFPSFFSVPSISHPLSARTEVPKWTCWSFIEKNAASVLLSANVLLKQEVCFKTLFVQLFSWVEEMCTTSPWWRGNRETRLTSPETERTGAVFFFLSFLLISIWKAEKRFYLKLQSVQLMAA